MPDKPLNTEKAKKVIHQKTVVPAEAAMPPPKWAREP
jgi:hypothetical protein